MKVLITGVAGFVGSHCAEYYALKGAEVYGIDNLIRSRLFSSRKKSVEYNWEYLARYRNVRRIKSDLRYPESFSSLKRIKFNLVIHTAAQPGVGFSLKNPEDDFHLNALSTFNILEFVRKYSPQATFIYCSTNKVYGTRVSKFKIKECHTRYKFKNIKGVDEHTGIDLTPHTPYGVSKYVGDIYTQEYSAVYRIKAAVFRMSCIYGTRQFGFEDQGWLAWFLISGLKHRGITIYGDGKQVRDVLYISDLVAAFDKFHHSPLNSEVFNIGGGIDNSISLLEYLKFLEENFGIKFRVRFKDWRLYDQRVYISNITKLNTKLNWKPKVDYREGVAKLYTWIKKNINLF
ncbi:MAG: hypothetical protein B6D53_00130 [Candidatus Omnitrophica bacterium 4484_49]|nr:MAG: hypothetical protein B6D53_00130 [Candidatus Omnitrophica bacterium 4484_49]